MIQIIGVLLGGFYGIDWLLWGGFWSRWGQEEGIYKNLASLSLFLWLILAFLHSLTLKIEGNSAQYLCVEWEPTPRVRRSLCLKQRFWRESFAPFLVCVVCTRRDAEQLVENGRIWWPRHLFLRQLRRRRSRGPEPDKLTDCEEEVSWVY